MPVLQFKGKTAVESHHYTVPHHTVEFDEKLSVLGKGAKPNLDGNVIIEGDNLLALKALLPTHAGRIKCIYIDPPYNTGNEGWVYNDKLNQPQFKEWIGQTVGKEGEDATRHDKWCCMMYPRLQLLRELLREDGLIFVSIDFTEVAYLRLLMDEIFGPENFLADIAWEKRYTRSNNAKLFYSLKDTILTYRKSGSVSELREPRTEKTDGIYKNPDNDSRGDWTSSSYVNPATKEERPNLVYPIKNPNTGAWVEHKTHAWKYSLEKHAEHVLENRLWWSENGKAKYPRLKVFKSDEGVVPIDLWHYQTTGTTDDGGTTVKQIFGSAVFETPKPVGLIRRILELATEPNEQHIVFDSTAGSGSTAHAVLELNKEDGGNRKFILVQQAYDNKENEKEHLNICQKITAERVHRVIKGYKYKTQSGKEQKVEGLGGSFTYARLGPPLFNEYRDLGERLPSYEEIAKYVFYTETSREFDQSRINRETGKIGEHNGASYYLLYKASDEDDQACDMDWLRKVGAADANHKLVVYCEKVWLHQEDLAKYEFENGKQVRTMQVPFQLK